MINIPYGAEVICKNGKVLGRVNHVVPDSWAGGIRKFVVRETTTNNDIILSPEDVLEEKESQIILKATYEDLAVKFKI